MIPEETEQKYLPIKTLDFGSGSFVEVAYLTRVFGIRKRTAMCYLRALHIQPIFIGQDVYFSLSTLNRILYVLSRPGAPGFVFPGSRKRKDHRTQEAIQNYLMEVTPEILKAAEDPAIMAEMMGAAGRDVDLLKKFINPPQRVTHGK